MRKKDIGKETVNEGRPQYKAKESGRMTGEREERKEVSLRYKKEIYSQWVREGGCEGLREGGKYGIKREM